MRFYYYRVAGNKAGVNAWQGIPYREGGAAYYHADALRDGPECFIQFDAGFAQGLFPLQTGRIPLQLLVAGGNGFQGAVAGMRTGGLEAHHKALARCMHGGVGDVKKIIF